MEDKEGEDDDIDYSNEKIDKESTGGGGGGIGGDLVTTSLTVPGGLQSILAPSFFICNLSK